MKKSLLISYFFPPKIGGIENYLKNLCLKLPEDKIIILVDKTKGSEDFDKNYERIVIRQPFFSWRFFKPSWLPLIWKVRKLVKDNDIEYLQFGHYFNAVTVGLMLKKLFGLPYLVYTHGVDTLIPQKGWFSKKLMILNLKNADYVIANTHFMKKKIMELGLFESQIIIIYPSLNIKAENIPNRENELRKKYGLEGQKVILTIGRLVKRKGQDFVIRSLPEILKKVPNLKYLIVGDGPDKDYLVNLAKELQVEKQVIFAGPIEDKDILKFPYYHLADLFIMPTREMKGQKDIESFGLVYLEAQAQGTPVIIGKAGGTGETIIEDETGLAVNPENTKDISDTVLKLLTNDNLKNEMGEKGKRWVTGTFNWDKQVHKLTNIIDQPKIIKKDKTGPALSIIIPAYKVNKYIDKCLENIYRQTFKDFEIIVVNDGPDSYLSDKIRGKYKDIKIIERKHEGEIPNQASWVRNLGAKEAKGKYLFFCDADIILYPTCFEKMIRVLEMNPEYDFCYSAFLFGRKKFRALPFSHRKLKKLNYISTMSMLRADKFPGFDENLARLQDWDLWLHVAKNGGKGLAIQDVLFYGPMRKGGISKSVPKEEAKKILFNKYNLNHE